MSSSGTMLSHMGTLPIAAFQYRQIMSIVPEMESEITPELPREPEVRMTESAFHARVAAERASAVAEVELKWKAEAERRVNLEAARVTNALETFAQSRTEYFSGVEMEVVQLALAIAGRFSIAKPRSIRCWWRLWSKLRWVS